MPQSYSTEVFGNPDLHKLKKVLLFFIAKQHQSSQSLSSADMVMGNMYGPYPVIRVHLEVSLAFQAGKRKAL